MIRCYMRYYSTTFVQYFDIATPFVAHIVEFNLVISNRNVTESAPTHL